MGTIRKGILGGINGRVGAVVGSKWRNLSILKSRPRRKNKRAYKFKNPQTLRLGKMSNFLSKYKDELNIGFFQKRTDLAPINFAMKYNLVNGLVDTDGDFEIDYEKIVFSKGNLEPVWSEQIFFDPGCLIRITWDIPQTVDLKIIGKDIPCVVIYDSTLDEKVKPGLNVDRTAKEFIINMDEAYAGNTFHAWIFFVSADGKKVSNSDYIGSGILTV